MLSSPSPSSSNQLSQLGASLYGPQSKLFFYVMFSFHFYSLFLAAPEKMLLLTKCVHFLGCVTRLIHLFYLSRWTWFLCKGYGKQYTTVKPKSYSRQPVTKSYHPYNRGPNHAPPYTSITKQVQTFIFFFLINQGKLR